MGIIETLYICISMMAYKLQSGSRKPFGKLTSDRRLKYLLLRRSCEVLAD